MEQTEEGFGASWIWVCISILLLTVYMALGESLNLESLKASSIKEGHLTGLWQPLGEAIV